jgi:hypothetical protein
MRKNYTIDRVNYLKNNSSSMKFDEEDFALTFVFLSMIFILFFLGFQIISVPHQNFLVIYAISDEGNFIFSNATKLHKGDELKLQVIIENYMKRAIDVKLQTVIAGGLNTILTEGQQNFTLNEQVFFITNENKSVAKIEFAVTDVRFEKNLITIEQVKLNDYRYNVFIESPSQNQTFRLIFNLLIWDDEEKRYVNKWSDGSKDRSSWLQIWFELFQEIEK